MLLLAVASLLSACTIDCLIGAWYCGGQWGVQGVEGELECSGLMCFRFLMLLFAALSETPADLCSCSVCLAAQLIAWKWHHLPLLILLLTASHQQWLLKKLAQQHQRKQPCVICFGCWATSSYILESQGWTTTVRACSASTLGTNS
jgi:hypothetical protein